MKMSAPSSDVGTCQPQRHASISRTESVNISDGFRQQNIAEVQVLQADVSLTGVSMTPTKSATSSCSTLSDTTFKAISRKSSLSSDNSSDDLLSDGDLLPSNRQSHHVNLEQLDPSTIQPCPRTDRQAASAAVVPAPPPPPPPPPAAVPSPSAPLQHLSAAVVGVPRPRTPTKRLQWTKVPASRVAGEGRPTVWTVVGRLLSNEIGSTETRRCSPDFDCLEQLFAVQTTGTGGTSMTGTLYGGHATMSGGLTDGMTLDRRRKADEILLLDSKRIMNVSIFLRQFGSHVTSIYVDIVTWLREGCSELLGAERLRNLLKILPEPDELQLLTPYMNSVDNARLGVAERFYLELMSVPHYELLVETLLLKEEFQTIMDAIKPAIDAIVLTARGIKDNGALHKILGTVLMAGNFLNSGAYAGEAIGFRLSSLLKLNEIRANKPQMNLMHYVAMEAEKTNEHVVEQLNRLKYLNEASQYSITTLHDDIRSLQRRVTHIIEKIHLAETQFQQQIQSFLKMAQSEMEALDSDIQEIENLRLDLAEYFCEDEKTFRLDECISTFNTFCQKFIKAVDENRERHLLDEQAEQRRRQREEQLAIKKNRYGAPILSISSSASCDDLLSSCTSTPSIYEPINPGSSLLSSSSTSLMSCSKHNVSRRQSTPIGLVNNSRCDDNLNNNDEITSALYRQYRRGSSMNFPEFSGSTGDLTSAEDLVDALLKDAGGVGNMRPSNGSPVLGGLCSPMFRRRKRSGVQLAEALSISRERTPSPRRTVNLNNEVLLTPEIFVDDVPFTAAADTVEGGLGADHQRRRTIDKSPTRSKNMSATQLTSAADAAMRNNGHDVDRDFAEQQKKKRDHEDRRLERRRQSDQTHYKQSSAYVPAPSRINNLRVAQSDDVIKSPGSVRQCPSVTITSATIDNSLAPETVGLEELEIDMMSRTTCSSTSPIVCGTQTALDESTSSVSMPVDNSCEPDDGSVTDRSNVTESALPVMQVTMTSTVNHDRPESASSSSGRTLKEKFQHLSILYADNDDGVQTTQSTSSSEPSASASKLNATLSTHIATTEDTPKNGDPDEYCDEGFESENFPLSPSCSSTSHDGVRAPRDSQCVDVRDTKSSQSAKRGSTKSADVSSTYARREVKQNQPRRPVAASSVSPRKGVGQDPIKQATGRSGLKMAVRFPAMTKSGSRQSLNAKISTCGTTSTRTTQKTAVSGCVKSTFGSSKTTTGRSVRLGGQRAVGRTASPCAIVTKATTARKNFVRPKISTTVTSSGRRRPNADKSDTRTTSGVEFPKPITDVRTDTPKGSIRRLSSETSNAMPPKQKSVKTMAAGKTPPTVAPGGVTARKLMTSPVASKTTRRTAPIKSITSRDRKSNESTSDSSMFSTDDAASP